MSAGAYYGLCTSEDTSTSDWAGNQTRVACAAHHEVAGLFVAHCTVSAAGENQTCSCNGTDRTDSSVLVRSLLVLSLHRTFYQDGVLSKHVRLRTASRMMHGNKRLLAVSANRAESCRGFCYLEAVPRMRDMLHLSSYGGQRHSEFFKDTQ